MSDINTIVGKLLNEEVGFHGVEMYNDKYPMYQDNGSTQSHAKPDGAQNLAYGNGHDYAKFETQNIWPNTKGRPNLFLGANKDYASYEGFVKGGEGKPAVRFGGSN